MYSSSPVVESEGAVRVEKGFRIPQIPLLFHGNDVDLGEAWDRGGAFIS